jgi:dienelactone hydrolase
MCASTSIIITKICIVISILAVAGAAPRYSDHQDLMYWLDERGQRQEVKTREAWDRRSDDVMEAVELVMGKCRTYEERDKVRLDVKVEEEVKIGELIRRKISYQTDAKTRVKAYLMLPPLEKGKRAPAILCLHQTTKIGKMEPVGLGPKANLHYALHLAQRGYVTLAPDYPSFGEYEYDFKDPAYISGSMRAIDDNRRAVDLLTESMLEVDPERIGCIGHSLGGHNAIFTAFFDARIKVIVSNCGFTSFPKYYGGKLAGWTSNRYMPRIVSVYNNDPKQVPFDFPELIGGLAPRAFLAVAPLHDDNFEFSGVDDCINAARPIYELFGRRDNLRVEHPDCAHDFPESSRKIAYEFFDRHLK